MVDDETTEPQSVNEAKREQARLAMQEYQIIVEDTAKIIDRRQTLNTLYVSTINLFFLSTIGTLLLLIFQARNADWHSIFYSCGILAAAVVSGSLNRNLLRLSEQSRRLLNLRIRYLEHLEGFMRDTGYFPEFDTPLKGYDPTHDREFEAVPASYPSAEFTDTDKGGVKRRWIRLRGTYSVENVLYNNPNPKSQVFGFSLAEQRVFLTFAGVYWLAFAASAIAVLFQIFDLYANLRFTIGPFHF